MRGKYERPRPKRRIVPLLIVLILLSAVGIAGVAGYGYLNDMLDLMNRAEIEEKGDVTVDPALLGNFEETQPTETAETTEAVTVPTTLPYTPSNQDIVNILVVGQAEREGENSRLADTMILATINKTQKKLTLTSFLRDAYVDMPDYKGNQCGWNRINLVYHLGYTWGGTGGAMENMNLCLKNNFGIEVDYNIEVDFVAFEKVIDILGGVRITLTEAEANYLNDHAYDWWPETYTEGEYRLFGEQALAYARMRKANGDGDSDIKRTARQRTLVTALVEKLARKVTSEGFDAVRQIAEEVLPTITTNMTNGEITTCIWELLPILPELTIETGTCPVETTYWGEVIDIAGVPSSVLKFYPSQNAALMRKITEGDREDP